MTIEQLARRVTELEERLRAVEVSRPSGAWRPDWRRAVREFKGDPAFWADVADECRKLREADREATRLEFERMDEAARQDGFCGPG